MGRALVARKQAARLELHTATNRIGRHSELSFGKGEFQRNQWASNDEVPKSGRVGLPRPQP